MVFYILCKTSIALPRDPKIVDEFKREALDNTNFDLMKPPSLQRRISEIKRMDFFQKMRSCITDIVLVDEDYLIAVSPVVQNRITKL